MKSFENLIGKSTRAVILEDRRIRQVISQIVPSSCAPHIEFCRIEGGRLRMTVDSAAWVARLRFAERQIIDALRAHHFDCHVISYHVSPAERPVTRKTVRTAEHTRNGSVSVQSAASQMPSTDEDDRLRQALLKLARTLSEDER